MNIGWSVWACLSLGMASALVGGVFLAFSDFVMRGLESAEVKAGMDSMQQLNRTVYRSIFLSMFLMLVPATIGSAAYAWFNLDAISVTLVLLACGIYLTTVFIVTAFVNVPLNEKLATTDLSKSGAEIYWSSYVTIWTFWNHVRTIGSIATATCYFLVAINLAQRVAN